MHLRGQVSSIAIFAPADRSGVSSDAYSKVAMHSDGITL